MEHECSAKRRGKKDSIPQWKQVLKRLELYKFALY